MESEEVPTTSTTLKPKDNYSPQMSDDEGRSTRSSIEALNWSEFEEEDLLLLAQEEAESGSGNGKIKSYMIPQESDARKKLEEAAAEGDNNESQKKVRKAIKLRRGAGGQRKEEMDTLGVNSDPSEVGSGSQAPVLDEGPIWGKGTEKSYIFRRSEENRRLNQKLTFGLILTLVLAIGLGIGNLVAYNECEAEFKNQPVETLPPQNTHAEKGLPNDQQQTLSNDPAQDIQKDLPSNPPPIPEKVFQRQAALDHSVDEDKIRGNSQGVPEREYGKPKPEVPEPIVDPKYSGHVEVLGTIVRGLKELSDKIDQFQNTTKQLGGIIMMREEAEEVKPQKEPETPYQPPEESDKEMHGLESLIDEVKSYYQESKENQELTDEEIQKGEKVFKFLDDMYKLMGDENPQESGFTPGSIYSTDGEVQEEEVVKKTFKELGVDPEGEDDELDQEINSLLLYLKMRKAMKSSGRKQEVNREIFHETSESDDVIIEVEDEIAHSYEGVDEDEDEGSDSFQEEFQKEKKKEEEGKKKWKNGNPREFIKEKNGKKDVQWEIEPEDDDDDDDDDERKKYRKEFKKEEIKREKEQRRREYKNNKREKKSSDRRRENLDEGKDRRDWYMQRAEMRSETRNKGNGDGDGEYRGGRKPNNWQLDRDRQREKFRTKV